MLFHFGDLHKRSTRTLIFYHRQPTRVVGDVRRPLRIVFLKVAYYASSSARNFAKWCQNYARITQIMLLISEIVLTKWRRFCTYRRAITTPNYVFLAVSEPFVKCLQRTRRSHLNADCAKRTVYTCDFWCDLWCDFAYKTRLTLPCTNVFFAKHRVDWKESYDRLFEDTLLSNSC